MSAVLSEARRGADQRAAEIGAKAAEPDATAGQRTAAQAARAEAPVAAATVAGEHAAKAARKAAEETAERVEKAADKAAETARDAAEAELSPVERLEASRARMREALLDIAQPRRHDPPGQAGRFDDLKDRVASWLRGVPGAGLLAESVESWWAQHPLHTAGEMAHTASKELLGPIARRNPTGLLLGAAAVGALLVVSRPWRWLLRPALFVGLVPQLVSQAMRRMPVESWVHMAAQMAAPAKRTRRSKASAQAGASTSTPPPAADDGQPGSL